ncbi:MAG TPA: phosphodiester glycosidase family protein [Longimicrobium sp.]|nr:phosphodiester glycosidase family protein [Longimicrobium sp.]
MPRWLLAVGLGATVATVAKPLLERPRPPSKERPAEARPRDDARAPALQRVRFREADYYVVHADLRRARVQLHWKDERGRPFGTPTALARWLERRGGRVAAVANAGIYTPESTPKGLHVERGRTVVPLNTTDSTGGNFFRPRPNGVFAVLRDGTAAIVRSDRASALLPRVAEATQSGPRLLEDGAATARFGDVRLPRTAVGVASPTDVFLVVSEDPVTLNDLAALFRERLGCRDALFLDGGAVQGLAAPAEGVRIEDGPFVGFLSVLDGPAPDSALAR